MAPYLYRVMGAAVFDGGVYEEIEADTHATRQAGLTVVLASIAAGLGAGGVWTPNPSHFAVASAIALASWLAWAMLTFQIGTWVLPGRQTVSSFGELLRTVGFSAAPGLLLVFAVLPGMAIPVFAVATIWMFAAMVVGVRHALDYPHTGRALAVCGLAAGLVLAMVVIFGVLFGPALAAPSTHHRDHMTHVWALEGAAIRGDRETARLESRWLAEHLAGLGEDDVDNEDEAARYRTAIADASSARDAGAVATAVAETLAACGSCHRASGLSPGLEAPPMVAGEAVASHMQRDGRAARLLVLGIVTPSDDLWAAGAEGLRRTPLAAGDFPVSDRIGRAMHEVDAAVRALGARAAEAQTRDERARAYGTLVAGCASCHVRHTTLWDGRP